MQILYCLINSFQKILKEKVVCQELFGLLQKANKHAILFKAVITELLEDMIKDTIFMITQN